MHEMTSARFSQARFIGLILLLILALGAIFRIVNLGSDSIWLDEAYSIQFARLQPAEIVTETAQSDVHPPLYYLALHFWVELFGDSETAARSLSTLFGLLSIFMIYLVAALLFDRATALLSALFLAVSLFHIEYAQEARMYTLHALLALSSCYFFLKLFLTQARARDAIGYVISTSLLMHTHVYGFFIIIAENLFFFSLFFSRRALFKQRLARWLLAQAALVALFLPWLSIQWQQFERVQRGFWIPRPPLEFLRLTWILHAGSRLLAVLFIPLVALGLVPRGRAHDGHETEESVESPRSSASQLLLSERLKILFLALWFLSSLLLPFIISRFAALPSIFLPKYTLAASCAFLLLAARGLMSIRADWARVLLVALLLTLSFVNMRAYWAGPHKDFWRESATYFDQVAEADDLVIFHQESGHVPFQYYSRRRDVKYWPFPDERELTPARVAETLRPQIDGRKRVWLVASHPTEVTALITKQLGEWYNRTEHRVYPGVELYLFER